MITRCPLLRALSGLFLALLLVCGALSGAAMSARMIGVSAVEICADAGGSQGRSILLDRQGQLVSATPDCPICLATPLAFRAPPLEPFRLPVAAASVLEWSALEARLPGPPALTLPQARAPPSAA